MSASTESRPRASVSSLMPSSTALGRISSLGSLEMIWSATRSTDAIGGSCRYSERRLRKDRRREATLNAASSGRAPAGTTGAFEWADGDRIEPDFHCVTPGTRRTLGKVNPAIAASIAVVDGVRKTDADRRSFKPFTKADGRQLMLAAVWPGQGHFL